MKKSLISGVGATALGISTLVGAGGVIATDGSLTQTDNVVVTVESSCSLASTGGTLDPASTYAVNLANGEFDDDITGSTFTITCNDTGGWKLTAVGYTNNVQGTTYMDASTGEAGDDIQTGTTLDGTVSDWAVKFAKGGSDASQTTVTYGNEQFAVIPDDVTIIATGQSTAGNATVTATYGVGVSPTQSAGDYTGKVLYTLAHPITETNNSNQNNDNSGSGGTGGEEQNSGTGGEEQNSGSGGTGGEEQNSGTGGSEEPSGGNQTPNNSNSGGSGNNSLMSLSPKSVTNNTTNNNTTINNYSTTNTTNTTSGGGGSYPTSGSNDATFATTDEPDTTNENKNDSTEEIEEDYEEPLGVVTSSNDESSSDSGMETGFLVALGAAAVAGVATYALIRSQDKEEEQ